jgi:DNA-binding transcriptional ArsR family regulator
MRVAEARTGIVDERSFGPMSRPLRLGTLGAVKLTPPPACLDDDPPVDPTPLTREEMAAIAKAMGHPARMDIVEYFMECRPHTVGEIANHLDLAQSTVSEHLRILRSANILRTEEDGPRTWHCLNRVVLKRFARDTESLTVRTDR